MEHDRTLRFLIPPFVVMASVYLGAALDPGLSLKAFYATLGSALGAPAILGVIASGGIAVIALGFLISSVGVILERTIYRILGQDYEAHISDEAFRAVWTKVGSTREPDRRQIKYLQATYGHAILPVPLNDWLGRRWTTFNVSINCLLGLLAAHLIGAVLHLAQTLEWWYVTILLSFVLGVNAVFARSQLMRMIEFLSACPIEQSRSQTAHNSGSNDAHSSEKAELRLASANKSVRSMRRLHKK